MGCNEEGEKQCVKRDPHTASSERLSRRRAAHLQARTEEYQASSTGTAGGAGRAKPSSNFFEVHMKFRRSLRQPHPDGTQVPTSLKKLDSLQTLSGDIQIEPGLRQACKMVTSSPHRRLLSFSSFSKAAFLSSGNGPLETSRFDWRLLCFAVEAA